MKHSTLTALFVLGALSPAAGAGKLRVVTTVPDLADVAREIGGDRIELKSIAKGRENIHSVVIKPSHLIAFNKADVLFQVGLSLEHAWVPGLLEAARNKKIRPGAPGFVNVSLGWEALLNVPEVVDKSQSADLHPEGNPHVNLHPRAGYHFANRVLEGLVQNDPKNESWYTERHRAYIEKLDRASERWSTIRDELNGKRAVTYHSEFDYLLDACSIELVATLEPKPGLPPTPGHIARVIQTMRAAPDGEVPLVLTAAWSNNKHTREVARGTGARVLELPTMVGGSKRAKSWIAMQDELHASLVEAYGLEAVASGSAGE